MKANQLFLNQKPEFWAYVKTISQEVGYTNRSDKSIKVPTLIDIKKAFDKLGLSMGELLDGYGYLTSFGNDLLSYFEYRSEILGGYVKSRLMNKDQAEALFRDIYSTFPYKPRCPLPMNKQKGDKRNYSFLTGIVNMILEQNLEGASCDFDPRILTSVTCGEYPVRTLSRRVDGAFPSPINPIAIWEIKEYYYTTTFGSRVADGVYETLLDGMEITELRNAGYPDIQHILIIDDYFTWWDCGRSYLCRIIDMLHMGYLEEVLFGREVVERLPILVEAWRNELSWR